MNVKMSDDAIVTVLQAFEKCGQAQVELRSSFFPNDYMPLAGTWHMSGLVKRIMEGDVFRVKAAVAGVQPEEPELMICKDQVAGYHCIPHKRRTACDFEPKCERYVPEPKPEPVSPKLAYRDLQAKWVKDNAIGVGSKVKITCKINNPGISINWGGESMDATIGTEGVVVLIGPHWIEVKVYGGRTWNYDCGSLEKVLSPAQGLEPKGLTAVQVEVTDRSRYFRYQGNPVSVHKAGYMPDFAGYGFLACGRLHIYSMPMLFRKPGASDYARLRDDRYTELAHADVIMFKTKGE